MLSGHTEDAQEPPREGDEDGSDDECEGNGDDGQPAQIAAVGGDARWVGEARFDEAGRPEVRLPVRVEEVAEDGDGPDDGVEPEDECDSGQRRPRYARSGGDGEDVRRDGEAEPVADDGEEADQGLDPDPELRAGDLDRVVE